MASKYKVVKSNGVNSPRTPGNVKNEVFYIYEQKPLLRGRPMRMNPKNA